MGVFHCPVHCPQVGEKAFPEKRTILKHDNDCLTQHPDRFVNRHIGPRQDDIAAMLAALGHESLDAMINAGTPSSIRLAEPPELPAAQGETEALQSLRRLAGENQVWRSYIGMGYHDCITPPVIQRNLLENPGWYTQYTPYQAEISQGRLEALLNFQTMVCDLAGMEIANASLLDEATAAAEAVTMCRNIQSRNKANAVFVSDGCHPSTLSVLRTRAEAIGIGIVTGDPDEFDFSTPVFAVVLQYPATDGTLTDPSGFIARAHDNDALAIVATDLLVLTQIKPPGELGADVAIGSAQRFGVPMGYGGPHAAFIATRDKHKRRLPGRIVGVSKDANDRPALRLALQTREQHIRRDKATSNICTAQALLANIASMYAVYHGPDGLRQIGGRVHAQAKALANGLRQLGQAVESEHFFDTITVALGQAADSVIAEAEKRRINLRQLGAGRVGIALDETVTPADLADLLAVFNGGQAVGFELAVGEAIAIPEALRRTSDFLTHPIFNQHHSETEMLRYLKKLEARDLSLTTSMIPLGSCTMKLNAAAEMFPIGWPGFAALHPFAPVGQALGYQKLFEQLEGWLAAITGFAAVSLQPNAGSQGEFAGLLAIRRYHESRGDVQRNVCLIPISAHGTNPASAVMAGMKVVPVTCGQSADNGDVDLDDLRVRAEEHSENLAAIMVTYPSTNGIFERGIREICAIVHEHGGQVYMDGANLNAQIGLTSPGSIGADVCHLNLHKTFCIPHGGGGPGVGPIGVAGHLAPFLPGDPLEENSGAVAAAAWGSAGILPISWMYIAMMGADGLTEATRVAILNANYIAQRLAGTFQILYRGKNGLVAHECIVDLRQFAKVTVEDVAKRLMDYGFHAPTISWPVAGTMMVEPTESEPRAELDRFCEAMISIHAEIMAIENGEADPENNLLKNAPHTAEDVAGEWNRPYSREQAVFPVAGLREQKYWPPVNRIDNVHGDRNPVCTCEGMDAYAE